MVGGGSRWEKRFGEGWKRGAVLYIVGGTSRRETGLAR